MCFESIIQYEILDAKLIAKVTNQSDFNQYNRVFDTKTGLQEGFATNRLYKMVGYFIFYKNKLFY